MYPSHYMTRSMFPMRIDPSMALNINPFYYYAQFPPYRQRIEPNTQRKVAVAHVQGGPLAPNLRGTVYFIGVPSGTEVCVEVTGLPPYQPARNGENPIGPHGFHIHQSGNCEVGDPEDPFQAAGGHWNPTNQPHGNHASDLPVLFSNNGYARMCFFTNKFNVEDVVGKAVMIHQNPDDYRTQPAGDAGKRLACGTIRYLQA